MEDRSRTQAPFDERAALDELERLRGQIDEHRSQRRAVKEEFDQFVRSFKTRRAAPDTATAAEQARKRVVRPVRPVAAEPALPESLPVPPESLPVPPESLPVPPESAPVPPESLPVPPESPSAPSVPQPTPAAPPATSRTRLVGGGALILLVAGGLAAWTLRNRAPEPAPSASSAPATPPATPEARPAATAPAPPRAELTTTHRVWMRVIVDGETVLENELPADTHVPLSALKTIVIRAGDAGAVRLSIDGRDQGLLGRRGEVVNRAFTVPAVR